MTRMDRSALSLRDSGRLRVLLRMNLYKSRFLAGLMIAGASLGTAAQPWQALGPEGGLVHTLVAEPGGSGRVLAISYGTLFVSDDVGRSWRVSNPGRKFSGPIATYAPWPARYLAIGYDSRLLRSEDHGETWTPTGHSFAGANVDKLVATPDGALYTDYQGGVGKSIDGGATFAPVQGIPVDVPIAAIVANPFFPQRLIAGVSLFTPSGSPTLYRSVDGGANWSPLYAPAQVGAVSSIVFATSNDVVAAIGGEILHSADEGVTWTSRLAMNYAQIVRPLQSSNELVATNGDSCYRSSDYFATMQSCLGNLPLLHPAADGFYALTAAPDGNRGYRVLASLAPTGVVALGTSSSIWTTSNRNLYAQPTRGLALAPGDSRQIFTGLPYLEVIGALLGTADGGATWQRSIDEPAYIRTVEFDPTTTADVATTHWYAAGGTRSGSQLLTRSGIYKSVDGGVSWNALDQGLPAPMQFSRLSQVRKIAFDARSCAAPPAAGACTTGPLNTVFAVSNGLLNDENYRVIKSTQGGANWMPLLGLPPQLSGDDWSENVAPSDIEVETSTSIIYVSVFGSYLNYDGSPRVPSIDAGVFRSADGGATWIHAANGLPLVAGSATTTQDVFALALHPRRAGVLWAAVNTAGGASRIYASIDSGANWSAIGPVLTDCDVRDLQVDAAAPDVIYASGLALNGSFDCVRRSEDGGLSWQSLSANLSVTTVFNLRQDSKDRRRLVIATENGVWETIAPSDKIFTDTGD